MEYHACLSETQMCSGGTMPSRSSNEPSAIEIASGRLLRSAKSWLPQRGQNLRVTLSPEGNSATCPVIVTWSFGKSARTKKAEPVSRWQSRQWQARTLIGSPVTVYFTVPQKHWPVRVTGVDLLVVDSLIALLPVMLTLPSLLFKQQTYFTSLRKIFLFPA